MLYKNMISHFTLTSKDNLAKRLSYSIKKNVSQKNCIAIFCDDKSSFEFWYIRILPIINTLWTKEGFYNKIQISKVRKLKIIVNIL